MLTTTSILCSSLLFVPPQEVAPAAAAAKIKTAIKEAPVPVIGAIEGAAVAGGSLRVGTRSRVHGPALAEREVELRDGAVVGAPDRPTTVSAPRIRAGADVVCHGTVWARVEGRTVPAVPEEEDTGEGEVAA